MPIFANSEDKIHEVAGKLPSPWGLYDMFGNVYEMFMGVENTISDDILRDPQSAFNNRYNCLDGVGGGYSDSIEDCISQMNSAISIQNEFVEDYGFRLVLKEI